MAGGMGKAEELFGACHRDKTKTDINIQLGVDPIFAPMKEVDVEKELESLAGRLMVVRRKNGGSLSCLPFSNRSKLFLALSSRL